MQISNNKLYKMIIWPTIAISFVITISLSLFIYFDVFDVITQANEVVNLKMNISDENIDIKKFNTVIGKIESKSAQSTTTAIKNIFK